MQKAEKQFSQLPETFLGLHVTRFVEEMKQFFEGMALGQTELTENLLAKPRPKIVMEELAE